MKERDRPLDPWAPDSGATFEWIAPSTKTGTETRTKTGTETEMPADAVERPPQGPLNRPGRRPRLPTPRAGRSDRRSTAAAVAVASVALAGSVFVVVEGRDDDGDPPAASPVSSSTIPVTLPPPTQTLDDVARAVVMSDTGDDVVLGRVDIPLARADGECSAPRLPVVLDEQWSAAVDVGGVRVGRPVVLDSTLVFATRRGPDSPIELVGVDTTVGDERWRIDLGSAPAVASATQAIDGVAVVAFAQLAERERSLIGVDLVSGERRWSAPLDDHQGVVGDAGAPWVIIDERVDRGAAIDAVTMLDAQNGDVVAEASGRFVGVVDGAAVVVDDDRLIVIGGPGRADARRVIPWASERIQDAVVVGGSIVVVDADDTLARVVLDGRAEFEPLELRGVAGIDPPARITSLRPLGDSSLLVTSGDAVHGGNVDRSSIELRWRRAGQLQEESPSDRGRTITVGDLETPYHRVIDASTGRVVFERPYGAAAAVEPVSNGIIVQNVDASGGWSYDARDIDGRRRWRLDGPDFLAVGDRYVVIGDVTDDRIVLTSIGEPPGNETRCGSVMREWVES